MPQTENRIVLVSRRTRLEELVARFNTLTQARFYVEHLGADFTDYQQEHDRYLEALRASERVLGSHGRIHVVNRTFLPNYVFGKNDVVVALGQDGLVANTIKYLSSQPLIGVNQIAIVGTAYCFPSPSTISTRLFRRSLRENDRLKKLPWPRHH